VELVVIAVGAKLPAWVNQGVNTYVQRMPRECRIRLVEIAQPKRFKNADPAPMIVQEGVKMLAAIPAGAWVVALDEHGKPWTSRQLAAQLAHWQSLRQNIALLIGGPDGLSSACKARADDTFSLSALTLPHGLARMVLAEQLYRAWTLHSGHPYHRD